MMPVTERSHIEAKIDNIAVLHANRTGIMLGEAGTGNVITGCTVSDVSGGGASDAETAIAEIQQTIQLGPEAVAPCKLMHALVEAEQVTRL